MDLGLNGLRALVTGSSRGLGYATARQLSLEQCVVVLNSRDPEHVRQAVARLVQESQGTVYGVTGDVSDPEHSEHIVQEAVDLMGGLDLLVTNAGGPPPGSFESFSDQQWQSAIDLTFLSHVRLIRAALPFLKQSVSPAVLTITSYSVKQPIPNLVLSNSIRAATAGLTKTLALELGGEGIRFNSILPAWTETERVTELMQDRAEKAGTSVEAEMHKQAQSSAFGRMGEPQEFGKPAAFLLSPAASYITGVLLTVDGGMYKGLM